MDPAPTRELARRYAALWAQATDLLGAGWSDGKGPATFALNDDGDAQLLVGDMMVSEAAAGGFTVLRVGAGRAVLIHVDADGAVRVDESAVTDPALN